MAIKVVNPNPNTLIKWFVKDADEIYKDMLVKHNSGADPVAAAHTGTTILGVTAEEQLDANGEILIYPVRGAVLECDYDPTATKQSFAVTDLGTQYDLVQIVNEMFLDPDDTTGGFMILVGYDNAAKKAYAMLESVDCLLM
jgi:hypothetical protein